VGTSPGDVTPAPRSADPDTTALTALRQTMRGRRGLSAPLPAGVPRAAVAIVLRPSDTGLELLLIKRAERADDPWSGHIALPGGREDPADATLEDTAIRETKEEIGLDLVATGELLGALDDLQPKSAPRAIVVRPFVAVLRRDAPLVLSDEVAAAFWVPLATLRAPGAIAESIVRVQGVERRVTSFLHGEHVVWGMTERILRQLLSALA